MSNESKKKPAAATAMMKRSALLRGVLSIARPINSGVSVWASLMPRSLPGHVNRGGGNTDPPRTGRPAEAKVTRIPP